MHVSKDKKKSLIYELIRFALTGVVCALFDYLVCQLIILAFNNSSAETWLITTISTAGGFVIGVILNYILSTYWVYQNVDKNQNTKSIMFIIKFVILSIGGLLVSVGVMLLCNLISVSSFNINIVDISIMQLIKDYGFMFLGQGIFWAYFISFCFKTLAGLIFNYITRKLFLYKAPKTDLGGNENE